MFILKMLPSVKVIFFFFLIQITFIQKSTPFPKLIRFPLFDLLSHLSSLGLWSHRGDHVAFLSWESPTAAVGMGPALQRGWDLDSEGEGARVKADM